MFNPYQYPQMWPQQSGSDIQGVRFVRDEAEARSVMVPFGQRALLMDSEQSAFYIKSTDANGLSTIEAYDFHKRDEPSKPDYVTREELRKILDDWSRNEPATEPASTARPEQAEAHGADVGNGRPGGAATGGAHYR